MTLGSLFDGSGGFPMAGILNGIEPLWASEIEPFPIMVTRNRFPKMKHYGDVSKIKGDEIEPVDIITFGSPCQDLSQAGKQAGLIDGERSSLFFEAIRIIKEMREKYGKPRYIVWENVPGAFSSNNGEDFREVLRAILGISTNADVPRPDRWLHAGEIVGRTFSLAWRVLDAQFWGVPQRRKRIFLVADFDGRGAGEILFESESSGRYSQKGESAWERFTSAPEGSLTENGGGISYGFYPQMKAESATFTQELQPTLVNGTNPGYQNGVMTLEMRSGKDGGGEGSLDPEGQISYPCDQQRPNPVCADARNGTLGNIAPSQQARYANTLNGGGIILEGNGSRPSHQGKGFTEDGISFTLNTTEVHAVCVDGYNGTVGGIANARNQLRRVDRQKRSASTTKGEA